MASSEIDSGNDYRERFEARIEQLKASKRIKVVYTWVGKEIDSAKIEAAAAARGVTLSSEAIAFYSRMNGCAVVWVPVDAPEFDKAVHKPKKGRPTMEVLEGLDTNAFRIIALAPIDEVLKKGVVYGESPLRLGIDFPGNFITPALVAQEGGVRVQIGDDHGADWQGRSTSFEDYVETVLATWGDVALRRAIYLKHEHGVGRGYFEQHPVALGEVLPPPPAPDAKKQTKLIRELSRGYLVDLSDDQVDLAVVAATQGDNEKLADLALDKLTEQPGRIRRHARTIATALVHSPLMKGGYQAVLNYRTRITTLVDAMDRCDAQLTLADRELILRDASRIWATRGRIAARAGSDILPAITSLLEASETGADANRARGAALHAAMLLGPQAASLLPLIEPLIEPVEATEQPKSTDLGFDKESVSLSAAMAVVSLAPERAADYFAYVLIALKSEMQQQELDYVSTLRALPPAMLKQAVNALLETTREHAGRIDALSRRVRLLAALGEASIEPLMGWLQEPAEQGARAHETILDALSGADLSDAERATAARVAKEIYVKQTWPKFLGYAYLFGGKTACTPEIDSDNAIVALRSTAGTLRSENLAKATLGMLSDRVDHAQLSELVEKLKWQDWGWLQDYSTPRS